LRIAAPGRTAQIMNRSALLFVALVCACSVPAHADSKRYGITSYDRIEVRGDMIVEINPSHLISAVAEGSRAALETLTLDVVDRTLIVSQRSEGAFGPRRAADGPIRLRLTAQNLAAIDLRGAGQVTARHLRGPQIVVALDGPGRIDAAILAGTAVATRSTGSGSITLSGRARSLQATVSGSSSIDAARLDVRDLVVRASGTGASRFAAISTARVIATGEAMVDVSGRPRCTVSNTGAGTVACGAGQRSALPTTSN
jgi:hypothetical protein